MPAPSQLAYGNEIIDTLLYVPVVSYPSLAANTSTTTTLTIPGILPLDFLSWSMQNPPAHIFLENIYVSAVNTAILTWTTDSTGSGGGGNMAVMFEVVRGMNAPLGTAGFPAALV